MVAAGVGAGIEMGCLNVGVMSLQEDVVAGIDGRIRNVRRPSCISGRTRVAPGPRRRSFPGSTNASNVTVRGGAVAECFCSGGAARAQAGSGRYIRERRSLEIRRAGKDTRPYGATALGHGRHAQPPGITFRRGTVRVRGEDGRAGRGTVKGAHRGAVSVDRARDGWPQQSLTAYQHDDRSSQHATRRRAGAGRPRARESARGTAARTRIRRPVRSRTDALRRLGTQGSMHRFLIASRASRRHERTRRKPAE